MIAIHAGQQDTHEKRRRSSPLQAASSSELLDGNVWYWAWLIRLPLAYLVRQATLLAGKLSAHWKGEVPATR
jgi:hypothetical protein